MSECAFHPGVETNVRCVECERPICPKDYVTTPVGYKCRECARPLPSARRAVKPVQLLRAGIAAAVVGIGAPLLVAALGLGFWLISIVLGMLTAEAARRASGGHRSEVIAVLAGGFVLLGTYLAGLGLISMALATAAAVLSLLSNRW